MSKHLRVLYSKPEDTLQYSPGSLPVFESATGNLYHGE
jgi:hypothetical protein